MPDTHVVLIKCRTNTQLIELLPQCITDACAPNGGRLVSLYWTDGPYDAVAMIELDSRLLPVFKLVIEADHVSNVVVMRVRPAGDARGARRLGARGVRSHGTPVRSRRVPDVSPRVARARSPVPS